MNTFAYIFKMLEGENGRDEGGEERFCKKNSEYLPHSYMTNI
jgi:hypothetical protein